MSVSANNLINNGGINMSKVYDFLNTCGVFYVSTINDEFPATRPFGAVMEYEGALYISSANTKEVYKQMKHNPQIQIVALKGTSREWIRINGKAIETNETYLKQAMLDNCPVLNKRYTVDSTTYALFKITEMKCVLNTDSGSTQYV